MTGFIICTILALLCIAGYFYVKNQTKQWNEAPRICAKVISCETTKDYDDIPITTVTYSYQNRKGELCEYKTTSEYKYEPGKIMKMILVDNGKRSYLVDLETLEGNKSGGVMVLLVMAFIFEVIAVVCLCAEQNILNSTTMAIPFEIMFGILTIFFFGKILSKKKLLKSGRLTTIRATVIGFESRGPQEDPLHPIKYPVYEYYEHGEIKRFRSQYGSSRQTLTKGQEVILHKNKDTKKIVEFVDGKKDFFFMLASLFATIVIIMISI